MVVVYIKVVGNLLIFAILKFHDFRPIDLGVMNFTNSLSGFTCMLDRFERLCFLAWLTVQSSQDDSKKVVGNFISFPESLGTLLLDSYNSSYDQNK